MLKDENGDGELDGERGELGFGVSVRERCVEAEPFVPYAGLPMLLTLSLRGQKPLLCAMPAVAAEIAGVAVPGVPASEFDVGRCRASAAARKSRFVVPSALVLPDRAEHTIATLC